MVRPEIVCLTKFIKKLDALKSEVLDEIVAISSGSFETAAAAASRSGRPRGRKNNSKAASSSATARLPPIDPLEEYTPKEAAPYLGIKLGTLRKDVAEGLIEIEREPDSKRYHITGAAIIRRAKDRGVEVPTQQ